MRTHSSFSRTALTILAIALVAGSTLADEYDDYAASLNQAWAQTNQTQMISIINARLSSETNDVMGLATKMYYHLWVDGILTNARQVADQLCAVVQQSGNEEAGAYASAMRDEVYSISLGEAGYLTQAVIEQMHAELSDFPSIRKCAWLAKTLAEEP